MGASPRVTGAKLARLVLSNSLNKGRHEHLQHTLEGLGAALVWRKLLKVLADASQPGCVRLGEDFDPEQSLAAWMADCTGLHPRLVEAALPLLNHARLLCVSEDEIATPVQPGDVDSVASIIDRGGRPRAGESREQRRERLAAERLRDEAAARAQGHLKMPITGGAAAATAETSARGFQPSEVSFSREVSPEVSVGGYGLENPVSGSEVSSREFGTAAAAALRDKLITSKQQQQQQLNSETRERDARETEVSETSFPGEVLPWEFSVKPTERVSISPEVGPIAGDAVRDFGLEGDHAVRAASCIQAWLDRGAPIEAVRAALEDARKRGDRFTSMNWLTPRVEEKAKGRMAAREPGERTETRPQVLDVLRKSNAGAQTLAVRDAIAELLGAMSLPPSPENDRRLVSAVEAVDLKAANLVIKAGIEIEAAYEAADQRLAPSTVSAAA